MVLKEIEERELFMKRFLAFVFVLSGSKSLWACAVCFGDPNSPMVNGAKMGVAFLLGVILLVLCAIVGVGFYWARRARLLRVEAALRGESLTL